MRKMTAMLGRALLVCLGTAVAGTLMLAPILLLLGLAQGAGPGEAASLIGWWLPAVLLLVALATAIGLVFVGLPVMAVLRAAAKEGGSSYSWSGAAGGFVLTALANSGGDPPIPNGMLLPLGAIYGAVAGFLFWRLFRKDAAHGS